MIPFDLQRGEEFKILITVLIKSESGCFSFTWEWMGEIAFGIFDENSLNTKLKCNQGSVLRGVGQQ